MAKGFRIVSDKDNGFKAFFGSIEGLDKLTVKVGIQGSEASASHGPNLTNVQLGTIHEFGAPSANIPQRSFIRSTNDENKNKYQKILAKDVKDLVENPKMFNARASLIKLGEIVRKDIIAKIQSNIPPALKPATIEAKGGDPLALVDTGLLLGSITSVVK